MASSSAPRPAAGSARMATTAATISSDYNSLIAEIRKTMGTIKGVAMNLERDKKFDEVKELDEAVLELLKASDECSYLSMSIQSVAGNYKLGEQPTNFGKLLNDEVKKLKVESPSDPQANSFYRQFKETIWNVHHAGRPMPGEEQEEIVMTSTQNCLLNATCPLTGKPVIELKEPVRRFEMKLYSLQICSMDCKHIYEKAVVMQYIKNKASESHCPAAGCPRILQADRVVCDPLLPIEIEEMRSRGSEMVHSTVVEDFTELDD